MLTSVKLKRPWYQKLCFLKLNMNVYLRAKFQVSNVSLTSFRQVGRRGGGTSKPAPKKPNQTKVKELRSSDGLSENQYALVIMDIFTGQMTKDLLNLLGDNKILLTNVVQANTTKFYQLLDLTVKGYAKRLMAQKFNNWYTQQVSSQLDKGIAIDEIDLKLRLSLLKPLHAEWLVDFYNHMASGAAKKIIDSGWASSGIEDANNMVLDSLPSVDHLVTLHQ